MRTVQFVRDFLGLLSHDRTTKLRLVIGIGVSVLVWALYIARVALGAGPTYAIITRGQRQSKKPPER